MSNNVEYARRHTHTFETYAVDQVNLSYYNASNTVEEEWEAQCNSERAETPELAEYAVVRLTHVRAMITQTNNKSVEVEMHAESAKDRKSPVRSAIWVKARYRNTVLRHRAPAKHPTMFQLNARMSSAVEGEENSNEPTLSIEVARALLRNTWSGR